MWNPPHSVKLCGGFLCYAYIESYPFCWTVCLLPYMQKERNNSSRSFAANSYFLSFNPQAEARLQYYATKYPVCQIAPNFLKFLIYIIYELDKEGGLC